MLVRMCPTEWTKLSIPCVSLLWFINVFILFLSWFFPIKHNSRVDDINKEVFFVLSSFNKRIIYVNRLTCGYVIYNFNILSWKREVINIFHDYMIPNDYCRNYKYVMNFNSVDLVSKFDNCTCKKLNTLYLTESTSTE